MRIITEKRCIIGEGPVWNEKEETLYYTNGMGGNELCMFDVNTEKLTIRPLKTDVAAYAFSKDNRLIVSRPDGVFILGDDDTTKDLYDRNKYNIIYANDMKIGPDGRIYVGTQSGKRKGVSDKKDGKLYSIDKNGEVRILIDGMSLSNGMEWSMDETRFFHTDSDTHIIREYEFNKSTGEILFSGREVNVVGVDGFTIDIKDNIYAACWGQGHIAVVDTKSMKISDYIKIPAQVPASCGFMGKNMDILAVTTASYMVDLDKDKNAGFTFMLKTNTCGRKPYLFGK